MAMKGQMIRFGFRQWAIICEEAKRENVSASQYVRDAAFSTAIYSRAQRYEGAGVQLLSRIIARADVDDLLGPDGKFDADRVRELLESDFETMQQLDERWGGQGGT